MGIRDATDGGAGIFLFKSRDTRDLKDGKDENMGRKNPVVVKIEERIKAIYAEIESLERERDEMQTLLEAKPAPVKKVRARAADAGSGQS